MFQSKKQIVILTNIVNDFDCDDDITCNDEKKIICENVIFNETTTKNEKFEINFRNIMTTNFYFENICDNDNLNKKIFIKNLFDNNNINIRR